ncbi:DNA-directed RNA polymerase, beta subunit [Dinoroseobacter shibae DFL 12 = DSM 16493]|uniref:DNA-directed RNA polymerase subunit beta n=1 Tax=Dinoroseobacter shibae (strain DSM 16493 / NCIMB 14021 / DFL 12) TaxID=398580 RepID=RPOB_DINSH|nr:DNA-directed RNA polymerase subunit beta [Dinoroseobacter shibae]A8LM40.1 RecName: Full=DNA-directed RNA polymerase subunit beta; Short=RNAP subunit beta; AltName: Full=RNA polymerase subunit beta; AltName: Full=Transcriptase subunit beta [Dinoroseobacter shibae DFL 12 = DSM 16493]ABV92017.1 DNA-directed RNA polymerase, beta subunit [Dinoroseobacter shibae DFL 12 = DSM 16493]URF46984.1 DNA-directed RNA polymerase subunit beta [Dinoroseobacter shibae]URF51295.1 DNA-directed RNA polymerase sub
MAQTVLGQKRFRKYYGKIREVLEMPNLIEVQKSSYDLFLKSGDQPQPMDGEGIMGVFQSVFPIKDFNETAVLEFVKYELEKPKYDVEECQQRDMTYSAPLKVTLRLIVFDVDEDTGAKSVKDIKEQDVFMGDMPLMTPNGTFIVNGTERVIVSQMHRSPGVFFDHDKGKTHSSGKLLFACRIIPYRGSWLDFEFDAKDLVFARIDRRRKLPVTTLLYSLGMDQQDIMDAYYDTVTYTHRKGEGWVTKFFPERIRGTRPTQDVVDAATGEVIAEAGKKVTPRAVKQLIDEGNVSEILVPFDGIIGKFAAKDIINEENGAIYVEAGDELTWEVDKDGAVTGGTLKELLDAGIEEIPVLDIDNITVGAYMRNTLAADKNMNRDTALMDIYRVMRPGEPPTVEAASALFDTLFFDSERYDLSAVGRVKMNMRLALDAEDTVRTLRKEDIVSCIKALVDLRDGRGDIDDIDHLGNRRVRSVGELMENQYRVGLLRMERAIKERMSSVEIDTVMPQDLINAKPAAAAVREFFGSSQLSQFMDQTNPLSEVTHKRRLSALGPGGLTRERAGFEVRDVHPTHYGRMCPIETPEGPNIGLINSLATFARVNKYGFIETPYRRVEDGKVTDEVNYMSATEEMRHTVAQANANLDESGSFVNEMVNTRQSGEYTLAPRESVDLIDVSPKQLVSVAASLIPFLENDDANRALMGSNMQRQAVPLLQADAPFVGTGIEGVVARDSGAAIMARRGGFIDQVDATRIVIRATEDLEPGDPGVDIYRLRKFQRSNQNTCINQRPLVKVGDKVGKDDVIADGPSTDLGELALGKNVVVAFMPWNGYNYEDSILISERVARDDVFTSIHIEEFEVAARDTKLGPEEITRDIPNVGEEALRNLDEAGIVYIGADVGPGDILVGKITPKGESPMTPEEKLLRAIFGEKASDVRDTSMRLPPGDFGTVVEVRVFNRHGVEKDERALQIEREEVESLARDRDDEMAILERNIYARLKDMILGKTAVKGPKGVKPGSEITEDLLGTLSRGQWWQLALEDEAEAQMVEALNQQYEAQKRALTARFEDKVEKVRRGDDLPPGVMKMVKVFIAVKRKLQPGDKMAGRHGNKGVISKVVPMEDMPFLADGTPVDFVLNPLGVPSRMNVGQILETHMGWAARGMGLKIDEALGEYRRSGDMTPVREAMRLAYGDEAYEEAISGLDQDDLLERAGNVTRGVPIATPVFDGAKEADVNDALTRAGFDTSGQSDLYDGRTGEKFARQVTVGVKYLLKLHHLVDDKIHARSTGPYSLVTQQPLGGKAQFGGQRFGEMEVWALEAYGAAYTLQEMLTVKSDDVAGRTKVYESIVKGEDNFEAGVPESFNVLVKEVRGLGLNMELLDAEGEE